MIIGITGNKGSGKTEVANYLSKTKFFNRLAFAKPIKDIAKVMFLFTDEQIYTRKGKETVDERWGLTPREALQRVGTEIGRGFSKDIWVKNLDARAKGLENVVVEDARFLNEAKYIRSRGGVVIGLKRPSLGANTDTHASEMEMQENWKEMVDYEVINDGTLEELYEKIDSIINGST